MIKLFGVRRRRQIAAIVFCLSFFAGPIAGQESNLRPPTEKERAALNHYRDVIHEVLEHFGNEDWDENVDYDLTDDVAVGNDPDVPLDINELIQRTYTMRPGSKLYEEEIAPVAKKLEGMTNPSEMAKVASQMKMMQMSVEVHFNRAAVTVDPPPGHNTDLHAPGAALAYRTNNYKFSKGTSVVLLFGDWKAATWRDNDGRFKFKHPAHQLAIENIVVQLDGSPERIEELLHNIKWQRVNDALVNANP